MVQSYYDSEHHWNTSDTSQGNIIACLRHSNYLQSLTPKIPVISLLELLWKCCNLGVWTHHVAHITKKCQWQWQRYTHDGNLLSTPVSYIYSPSFADILNITDMATGGKSRHFYTVLRTKQISYWEVLKDIAFKLLQLLKEIIERDAIAG